MFLNAETLERRCRAIRRSGVEVAPLGDAVRRLLAGELTEPTVALTFDDGFHDFHRRAAPILRAYDLPVTVYVTTFYVDFQRPIFNLIVPYMYWKIHGGGFCSPEARRVLDQAVQESLSAQEKDALARRAAASLGLDYDEILASRILQLLSADEVRELANQGFNIQLHTHRHRTPDNEALFRREIDDNRRRLEAFTGRTPTHFCYPSGVHDRSFLPWLAAEGVETATTCLPAMAAQRSHPLLLPRKVDTMDVSDLEFEAWLSGVEPRLRGLSD